MHRLELGTLAGVVCDSDDEFTHVGEERFISFGSRMAWMFNVYSDRQK